MLSRRGRGSQREMTKFSVGGGEDGEGPSSPRPKRAKISISVPSSSHQQSPSVPVPLPIQYEEDDDEEEDDDDEDSCESEEEEEEEDEEEAEDLEDRQPLPRRLNRLGTILEASCFEEVRFDDVPVATMGHISSSSSTGPRSSTTNGSISVSLTDPEVLDCPICCEPLTIPVFQCDNGHVACSTCCNKLAQKCPSCSLPIGYNRCRAIEKVLEAVKIPCQNIKYGCKEMISYCKKYEHDKTCTYAPCSCPLTGCNFISSPKLLHLHCSSKHAASVIRFQYNITFHVFFTVSSKFIVLQEEKEGVLFILNNRVEPIGNMITVSCIGLSSSKVGYFYELTASMEGSNLRFQSFTKNIQTRVDKPPSAGFLLVPNEFFGSHGAITLEISIWRRGAWPLNIQGSKSAI